MSTEEQTPQSRVSFANSPRATREFGAGQRAARLLDQAFEIRFKLEGQVRIASDV